MGRAFSLIEILVAIAIICVLVALLFPVFASAKIRGKISACSERIHQQGIAVTLYQSDNADAYPNAVERFVKSNPLLICGEANEDRCANANTIDESIRAYTKGSDLFVCPLDIGIDVLDFYVQPLSQRPSSHSQTGSSYWFNEDLMLERKTQTSLPLPSTTALTFDRSGAWHTRGRPMVGPPVDPDQLFSIYKDYRYNVLYCDLHIRSATPREVSLARGAINGGGHWLQNSKLP